MIEYRMAASIFVIKKVIVIFFKFSYIFTVCLNSDFRFFQEQIRLFMFTKLFLSCRNSLCQFFPVSPCFSSCLLPFGLGGLSQTDRDRQLTDSFLPLSSRLFQGHQTHACTLLLLLLWFSGHKLLSQNNCTTSRNVFPTYVLSLQ